MDCLFFVIEPIQVEFQESIILCATDKSGSSLLCSVGAYKTNTIIITIIIKFTLQASSKNESEDIRLEHIKFENDR